MCMAAGIEPPAEIFVHGWLLVGGQKLCKTMIAPGSPATTAPRPQAHRRLAPRSDRRLRRRPASLPPAARRRPRRRRRLLLRGHRRRATTPTWPTTSATSSRGSPPSSTPSAAGSARRPHRPARWAPVARRRRWRRRPSAWARWAPHEALEETWRLIGAANAELEAAEPWKMEPGPASTPCWGRAGGAAHRGRPDCAGHAVDRGRGVAPDRPGGRPVDRQVPGTPLGRLRGRRGRGEGRSPLPAAEGLTVARLVRLPLPRPGGVPPRRSGRGDRLWSPCWPGRPQAGVTAWSASGRVSTTSEQAVAVARATAGQGAVPRAWATIGLHPHEASQGVDEVAALLDARAGGGRRRRGGRRGVRAGLLLRAILRGRATRRLRSADRAGARARPGAGDPRPRRVGRSLRRVGGRRRARAHGAALLHRRSRRGGTVPARRACTCRSAAS